MFLPMFLEPFPFSAFVTFVYRTMNLSMDRDAIGLYQALAEPVNGTRLFTYVPRNSFRKNIPLLQV